MPLTADQLAYAREVLLEDDAVMIDRRDSVDASLLGDAEIQRGWDEVSPEDVPILVDYLSEYTSEKNASPSRTVVDPRANNETFTGTWRQAYTRRVTQGNSVSTIVQVLRKGYITNLVTAGILDWSEARLETSRFLVAGTLADSELLYPETGGDTTEEYVTAKWNNVSPDDVHDIVDSIRVLDSDGFAPDIRGEAIGSDFHLLYLEPTIEDDGSATIMAVFAKPEFSLKAFEAQRNSQTTDTKYLWGIPKPLAQEILDNERAAGRTATASYSKQTGLVDIIIRGDSDPYVYGEHVDLIGQTCDSLTYGFWYWGVYNPDIYDIPLDPEPGVTFGPKRVSINDDGTYDIRVDVTLRQTRNYDWRTTFDSQLGSEETHRQFGITDNGDIIDIEDVDEQGVTYRQDVRVRDDCSKDIVTQRDLSQEKKATFSSFATSFKEGATSVYKNQRTIVSAPPVTGSGVYRARNSFNEDGTWDAELTYEAGTNTGEATFETAHTINLDQYEVLYKSSNSAVDAPQDTLGVIYRAANRLNEDGTYDANLQQIASIEWEESFQTGRTPSQVTESTQYRNQISEPTIPAVPASSQGVYRMSRRKNDDGTWDADLDITIPNGDGQTVTHESLNSTLQDVDTTVYRNSPTAAVAPPSSQGTIFRASNSINEDGTYNASLDQVVSSEGQHVEYSARNLTQDVFTNITRNETTPPQITSGGTQGVSRTSTWSINEDGTYNVRQDVQTAKPLSVSFDSSKAALVSSESTVGTNQTAVAEAVAGAVGVVQRASNRQNPDGTYSTVLEEITATAEDKAFSATHANLETIERVVHKYAAAQQEAPASSQGVIGTATNSINDDGTVNAVVDTITSTPSSVEVTVPTAAGDGVMGIFKNQTGVPAFFTGKEENRNSASASINRDGTYNFTMSSFYDLNGQGLAGLPVNATHTFFDSRKRIRGTNTSPVITKRTRWTNVVTDPVSLGDVGEFSIEGGGITTHPWGYKVVGFFSVTNPDNLVSKGSSD